jgi:hypothetical protein
MWLVDPWFLDGRGPEEVRVEFHDRIAGVPREPRIEHTQPGDRESETLARAEREEPHGCRPRYDNGG